MRILHTADWHIGQRLYERQRLDEHEQFLTWLLQLIKEYNVDLLLVSGDIFDTSLPSAEATNLYYRFLYNLYKNTSTYTIIIAGNHDSARHLEAPKEFLKMGRIHVVGHATTPEECVIQIPPDDPKIAVAAVPYLSENELPHVSLESEIEKSERYRQRLKSFYAACVSHMPTQLPKILMGHLFVHNGKVMDSERNIQIGGASAIHATDFPNEVDYIALGHLHRPQSINEVDIPIRYSGSPIPLRFNEAAYYKKVFLLEFSDNGEIERNEDIEIPVFKELCTISGDENSILMNASSENWESKYIQVKLKLDSVVPGINDTVRQTYAEQGGDVLSVEIELPEPEDRPQLNIDEMKSPEAVFAQYHKTNFGEIPNETMQQTFKELLQMVETKR